MRFSVLPRLAVDQSDKVIDVIHVQAAKAVDIAYLVRVETELGRVDEGLVQSQDKLIDIIPVDHTAAIGDQQNDISMLETAALSIAMGNAPDSVKSVAQHIAPTNDEGGLAWALENLVLKAW